MNNINSPVATFLHLLFGAKPEKLYVLLWEKLGQKTSHWFRDVERAVEFAAAHTVNLYAGVALSPEDFGRRRRCKNEDAAGLVGLYADIDIFGPGHQSENLPPTEADALSLLPPEFSPSLVVHSGHGLQVWWLFKEPWIFGDADDRERAQELTKAWDSCIRERATARGWAVDPVFDLARVMRVPGTINRKEGSPDAEARIMSTSDVRYNPSDFDDLLDRYPGTVQIKVKASQDTLPGPRMLESSPLEASKGVQRIDPYEMLGWAVERVRSGKHRNRTGYDLCEQARDNGYSREDAATMGPQYVNLVAGLRTHPYTLAEFNASLAQAYSHLAREPWALPKVHSVDTDDDAVDATVADAVEAVVADAVVADADTVIADAIVADGVVAEPKTPLAGNVMVMPKEPVTADAAVHSESSPAPGSNAASADEDEDEDEDDDPPDTPSPAGLDGQKRTPEEKMLARAIVACQLKLNVKTIEKHGSVKGSYRMHLADSRQFDIGDAKVLESQTQFRVAVIDGLNQQIPRLSRAKWDKAVKAMLGLVETIDTLTPSEMVAEELESYLAEKAWFCTSLDDLREDPEEMMKWMEGVKSFGSPICEKDKGGRVILSLRSFVAWIQKTSKTNLTALEFANILSRFGFKKVSTIASATFKGRRVKLNRVWVADRASLPVDIVDNRAERLMRGEETTLPVRRGGHSWQKESIM